MDTTQELAGVTAPGTVADHSPARLSVILVRKAADDLNRLCGRTRYTKTDVTNRAISLYEFVSAESADGAEFIMRKDGQDHLVKLQ